MPICDAEFVVYRHSLQRNFFVEDITQSCTKYVCYPFESSFFPVLLLLLVTIILLVFIRFFILPFIIIIFGKWKQSNIPSEENKNRQPTDEGQESKQPIDEKHMINWKEIIISLIIPVVIIMIPFFINTPLLMYDVSESSLTGADELRMSIYNLGLTSAKNVIISLSTNNPNLLFSNFTTEPIMSTSENDNTTQLENAFLKIDVLPPASETVVTSKLSGFESTSKFNVYVRSDQWVAYHHLISIGIIYFLVTGLTVFILFGKDYVKKIITTG
jgi:hypothetical protein